MAESCPRASIFRSEEHLMDSKSINRTFQISIWYPPSYEESDQKYPVVYILDSDAYFGAFANLGLILWTGDLLPEYILVGIGYGINSYEEGMRLRMYDLMPPGENEKYETGGAESFLNFVENELVPYMDANYRAMKGDRSIIGHSAGGFFALYAMFHRPKLFQRYCAGTPAPNYDNSVLFRYEEGFFKENSDSSPRGVLVTPAIKNKLPLSFIK